MEMQLSKTELGMKYISSALDDSHLNHYKRLICMNEM